MFEHKDDKNPVLPKIETIISSTTIIKGNLNSSSGTIRIDGSLEEGSINSEGLVIGKTGKVIGDIEAQIIIIGGEVHGNIKANTSLELLSEAKIYGDIETPNLIVANGSLFEGNCNMPAKNKTIHKNQNKE